jgi:hypothetical protein
MGLSPLDVDRMSLSQWLAVCDGWNAANGGEEAIEAPGREDVLRGKELIRSMKRR